MERCSTSRAGNRASRRPWGHWLTATTTRCGSASSDGRSSVHTSTSSPDSACSSFVPAVIIKVDRQDALLCVSPHQANRQSPSGPMPAQCPCEEPSCRSISPSPPWQPNWLCVHNCPTSESSHAVVLLCLPFLKPHFIPPFKKASFRNQTAK